MRGELHYDAVVIGAGTAGLVAGARLAEGGARVCVLSKGIGSTHLAPGTIDVLGYAPARVSSPRGRARRARRAPARSPVRAARPRRAWRRRFAGSQSAWPPGRSPGTATSAISTRNMLLPTAVGALRPSALVPETMAAGDASSTVGHVCVVGTRALRDFHASLCAANLSRAGVSARSLEVEIETDRADQNALGLARRFDDPAWRAAFAARLALKLQADERVGLPAMLGIRDPQAVWSDLEHRLGRPVFEIPTLPPSVPGMRVYEILRSALRRAGGRLVLGAEVVSCERDGSRVASVATASAGHDGRYAAPWFVLAAGGFGSGAIELDSRWATHERVFGLPLRGLPAADEPRFVGDYLAEQPMSRVGIAVDARITRRGCGERAGGGRGAAGRGAVARGIGRGDRAGQRRPRRSDGVGRRRRSRGGGGMSAGAESMSEHNVLEELMRGSLDHCVKCTICETQCPVSNVTPLFPGPKYAGPQAERYRIADEPSVDSSVDYCSGCGICSMSCPQGVKIAEINSQARNKLKQQKGIPLRDRIITRPTWLGRAGTPVAPLANFTIDFRPARILGEKLLGIHRDAAAPDFAGRRFSRWARKHPSPATGRKIVYFHGCGTEYYEPWEGEKVVAILEHNGFEVVVPKQDCCGLPLQSSGLFDDARKVVLRLARALVPYVRDDPDTIIVGNATSCTLMLKREAREILSLEDDPDLKLVSERTYDICELLLELHDRGELKTDFKAVNEHVFYHAPCQQQGHWIGKPALELFALIPGLEVTEGNARCCGIAGTYGLKAEKYDISMAVGADLFGQVKASGAGEVACDSETCRWQISHATGHKSVHPIDYLHRAYGL